MLVPAVAGPGCLQGGGIPADISHKVFRYGFTTARDDGSINEDTHKAPLGAALNAAARQQSPLAGLGFGLPLSRLHARYFGGELQLVNLPGYGVDVFIFLKKLGGQEWQEEEDAPTMYANVTVGHAAAQDGS